MKKTLKVLYTAGVLIAALGLLIGPISWYLAYSFKAEYDEFAKTAGEAKGTIYKKFSEFRSKSSTFYVSLHYSTHPYDVSIANKVKVLAPMHSALEKGDRVVVLYGSKAGKPGEVRIKGETDDEYLPPIRKPYLGIIITIYSYGFFLFVILFRKRIIRYLNNVIE